MFEWSIRSKPQKICHFIGYQDIINTGEITRANVNFYSV